MELRRDVDRLRQSMTGLWLLVLLVASVAGIRYLLANVNGSVHRLHVSMDGETVRVRAAYDGPYVVFGLTTRNNDSAAAKRYTVFDSPVVIVDSRGADIGWRTLKWRDYLDRPAPAPTPQAVDAMYVEPRVTTP